MTVTFPDGTVQTTVADPVTGAYTVATPAGMPDGGEVTVTATDPAGNVSEPTVVHLDTKVPSPSIVIAYAERHRLDPQVVTGYRFNAGEQVCLVVHSEPYEVGCDTADEAGSVTFAFQVPSGFDLGDHTATLMGQSSQLSASTSFTVLDTPSIRTSGTSQSDTDSLLYGVLALMMLGSTGVALAIRRLKVTN